MQRGLRYVYTGNVHDVAGGTTTCPSCGIGVMVRDWYRIEQYRLTGDGRCAACGARIAGVFDGPPGEWGRRRRPVHLSSGRWCTMSPELVRLPAVAGAFYPADPGQLADTVDELIAAVPAAADERRPIALVVPHAGYVYSGAVAATAYARLRPWRDAIGRVVIVGPAHRVPVRGLALLLADACATPLGPVPIDRDASEAILGRPGTAIHDDAHAPEHSVEVQLPFLQRVLGDGWMLVPVVAGFASASLVAEALADVWATPGTLVIISTDLSHYHDRETATWSTGRPRPTSWRLHGSASTVPAAEPCR